MTAMAILPDDGKTARIAGSEVTLGQVRATVRMLDYFRRFLRTDVDRMIDPLSGWMRTELDHDGARAKLAFLIHTAINRRAGVPDRVGRKQEADYQAAIQRDCRGVNDAINHRRRPWGLNGRRWETDEIQARYGHLVDPEDR
jgi:hypothetical protein